MMRGKDETCILLQFFLALYRLLNALSQACLIIISLCLCCSLYSTQYIYIYHLVLYTLVLKGWKILVFTVFYFAKPNGTILTLNCFSWGSDICRPNLLQILEWGGVTSCTGEAAIILSCTARLSIIHLEFARWIILKLNLLKSKCFKIKKNLN